jgi:hypothetical protein
MLTKQEVEQRLNEDNCTFTLGKQHREALETALRLWVALEDEVLGFQGPFMPVQNPLDEEAWKKYHAAIRNWSNRRHEHWSWLGLE